MSHPNYFLDKTNYTFKNAIFWGNCAGHFKKARKGNLCNRIVHVLIAFAEVLPIIGQIASLFEKFIATQCNKQSDLSQKKITKAPSLNINKVPKPIEKKPEKVKKVRPLRQDFEKVINETTVFKNYKISLPPGHVCEGFVLTGFLLRPSNLFFDEIFKDSQIKTTLPGYGKLFAFNLSHEEIRGYCQQKVDQEPHAAISFSANGQIVSARIPISQYTGRIIPLDLGEIYGNNVYRMNYQEIWDTLESQKIFTSSMLPLPFYSGLKAAMKRDNIIILPGNDANPVLLKDLQRQNQIGAFLVDVKNDPLRFGFQSKEAFEKMLEMTLYQIGSMVIKSEDYRLFVDGDCKIFERVPGQNDAIRLINACGIRGIHSEKTPKEYNKEIMTATFKTALKAAEKDIVVFPAVGMGVWRGDPELYWKAFLDAILSSGHDFELVCVNPRHQKSVSGKYRDSSGEEFQQILDEYKIQHADNAAAIEKLNKIHNLYDSQKDVVQLAHNFKKAFPDKIISLFNASDPDVTLGYHVGEYVNNVPHIATTEENYTAMGTNGLCFEGITGVHEHPERLIQG